MAKLPGWEYSTSTAMPRKQPALRPAPAMMQPAIQKFVPREDPQDYMRLASAEAGKYQAINKTVQAGISLMTQVIEADETTQANADLAQYNRELGEFTAGITSDKRLYLEEESPDGTISRNFHWENAEEQFDDKVVELQDRIFGDRNIRTREVREKLQTSLTRNDDHFRNQIRKFVTDRYIDKGRLSTIDTLDEAKRVGNIQGIMDAGREGVRCVFAH